MMISKQNLLTGHGRGRNMKIKFNLDRLREIIDDVHIVLGVSLSIVDLENHTLYMRENSDDDFCTRILSCPEGRYRCACSDRDIIARHKREGGTVSHICHAGILDTVVPLIKDGITVGYIFVGRVRPTTDPVGIAEKLEWLGDSEEEINTRYSKLAYYSDEQMTCIKRLVSNILFDSAVQIVHDTVAEKATDYIKMNIRGDLSVSNLCKTLFVSKNCLYTEFHKYYGMTVNEYVSDYRIELSKKLLSNGDKSVSEVSEAVGITSNAYFCKLFKQRTGLSPTEYRRLEMGKK